MVKIGFIVEGKTERKIVESVGFIQLLESLNIELVQPIINAGGNGNLLPQKLTESLEILNEAGAEKVLILTDLDDDSCITNTRKRIAIKDDILVIVAVKQIESWFLADSEVMSLLLNENFYFSNPENEPAPFETLKQTFLEKTSRGVGTKDILTARMLKHGFSLQRAAQHPNCPSAAYFLNKLHSLNHNIV